jgi:serine/threonine protein kinase
MALSAGTRLGPYEIVAPLGAGGMGEVWRARDTRLGREVAVKVLPEDVGGDPRAIKPDPAESGPAHVNVVLKWFEEVKRRMAGAK